jgi:hypothetical protein
MFACAVGDFLDGITFLLADIRDNSRNLETQVARKYFLDHGITVIYMILIFGKVRGTQLKIINIMLGLVMDLGLIP